MSEALALESLIADIPALPDCCHPRLSVAGAAAGGPTLAGAAVVEGGAAAAEAGAAEGVRVDQLDNTVAWGACRAVLAAYSAACDARTSLRAGARPSPASYHGPAVAAADVMEVEARGMAGVGGVAGMAQSFAGAGVGGAAEGAQSGWRADWLRAFA